MADTRPIGLFDSGVGGLSIWREVVRCLPGESTIYFADSANCPYGNRPADEIRVISKSIVRFLLGDDCKLIVVACNTASIAALKSLRAEFDIPIVGIEPAIKPATELTKTGHIGVLATAGTVNGGLFQQTMNRYANGATVHIQIGKGLVEQIEGGQLDKPEIETLLRRYLKPMLAGQVDQIVLGCTHYPLLLPLFRRIAKGQANIIDPAQAVVSQIKRLLKRHGLESQATKPQYRFYTTGQPELLRRLASTFSEQAVEVVRLGDFWKGR